MMLFSNQKFDTINETDNSILLDQLYDQYKNVPVLVTGGAGFIGSDIVELLVKAGARITILDDLSSGSLENIEQYKHKITLIKDSITNFDACMKATKGQKVIFHLAAVTSIPYSFENPRICYQTNVGGLMNILECARLNSVESVIFSSSSAVYGPNSGPCSEMSSGNPQSPYGFSKLMGELICRQYAAAFNVNTVILRYFNVFGPRQNPQGPYAAVIAKFRYNMQHNLPITIFGDGNQTRDFVSVAFVSQANFKMGILAPHVAGEVFNIASGKSVSMLELFNTLKAEYPTYTHEPTFAPERNGDVKHSQAHCSKYEYMTKYYEERLYEHIVTRQRLGNRLPANTYF